MIEKLITALSVCSRVKLTLKANLYGKLYFKHD